METPLRLLAVLAHPDDESLAMGGTLALYARQGAEVHLVTATRGERGRCDFLEPRPDDREVGRIREAELREAAAILGLTSVTFLDYGDGDLDRVDPREATSRVTEQILRIRPQVVATFAPDGLYGHPDHIAISQFTTAAVTEAASRGHAVAKLYYLAWSTSTWTIYQNALKELVMRVGEQVRRANPWPDWALTTILDTRTTWPTVWRAVSAHRSQVAGYRTLARLPGHLHETLWGTQSFYRALSLVNGGSAVETDLFEGLRPPGRRSGLEPGRADGAALPPMLAGGGAEANAELSSAPRSGPALALL